MLDRRVDHRFAPRRLNPAIPHALEAITVRCLAYRDTDRYPHAQALADDLQRFLDRRPLQYAANPSVPERIGNWSRRHWLLLAAGSLAAGAGAYPTLRRLTPVEDRAEFRAAVADFDKGPGPYDRAKALLKPLDEEFPDSPLVQFYYSVALGLSGEIDQAAVHLPRALRDPDGQTALRDWVRTNPRALRLLESLGMKLEDKVEAKKGEIHPYRSLANAALRTAIRLGSKNENIYIYDAVFDESQQRHELALEKLTRLREAINGWYRTQAELADHLNTCNYYRVRARIIIKLAGGWKLRGSREDLEQARSCYLEALKDLETGARLIARSDVGKRAQQDLFRAEAELGFGDVALRLDRRDEARAHLQQADTILAEHRSDEPFRRLVRERAALRRQWDGGSPHAGSESVAVPPS